MTKIRSLVLSRYVREPLVLAVAYFLYYLVRNHAAERTADAFKNAAQVVRLEQQLGLFQELSLQAATLSSLTLTHVANIVYFYGHFPLIILVGGWLFWKHPPVYSLIRNAFLASGAIALVVFVLFPVAPPRLIDAGFADTLRFTVALTYDKSPGVNEFAAMPSMHVGWDLLLALGIFLGSRNPVVRVIAVLMPPAMVLSTVVTGNHYLLDAPAGITVAISGLVIALLIQRYWPRVEERVPFWAELARASQTAAPSQG